MQFESSNKRWKTCVYNIFLRMKNSHVCIKKYMRSTIFYLTQPVRHPIINLVKKTIRLGKKIIQNPKIKSCYNPDLTEDKFSGIALCQPLQVLSGPFKGMKYPELKSVGSAIYPKILGTYEREINETVEKIICNNYVNIIDVGCAEGYYAIGLALRCSNTNIYAFDTSFEAIRLCELSAIENNVNISCENKFFDCKALEQMDLSGKSLIISDCEGYEKQLFTSEFIHQFSTFDFLIECHDFIHFGITEKMKEKLKTTHKLTIIKSIDDLEKVKLYNDEVLEIFTCSERYRLLAERRPTAMEWIFAESIVS